MACNGEHNPGSPLSLSESLAQPKGQQGVDWDSMRITINRTHDRKDSDMKTAGSKDSGMIGDDTLAKPKRKRRTIMNLKKLLDDTGKHLKSTF